VNLGATINLLPWRLAIVSEDGSCCFLQHQSRRSVAPDHLRVRIASAPAQRGCVGRARNTGAGREYRGSRARSLLREDHGGGERVRVLPTGRAVDNTDIYKSSSRMTACRWDPGPGPGADIRALRPKGLRAGSEARAVPFRDPDRRLRTTSTSIVHAPKSERSVVGIRSTLTRRSHARHRLAADLSRDAAR